MDNHKTLNVQYIQNISYQKMSCHNTSLVLRNHNHCREPSHTHLYGDTGLVPWLSGFRWKMEVFNQDSIFYRSLCRDIRAEDYLFQFVCVTVRLSV